MSLRHQIDDLSADHSPRAGSAGEDVDEFDFLPISQCSACGKDFKCKSGQIIACKQGMPFWKYAMQSRFSAPKVVVVHAGKIIMDQRIGVDAFQGASGI